MHTTNMELKRINRNRIYQMIMQMGKTSKSELGDELKLSLPTITQNLNALIDMDLIVEEGEFESTGGRRAKMISCNPTARVAVGMNITRNHIGIVIVDLLGNVVSSTRERFVYEDSERYYTKIESMIDLILHKNHVEDEQILGVGISIPAIIGGDKKTLETALVIPFPDGLYERMRAHIRFPYFFFNDANSGGYAEFWNRKSGRDLFYFSLSGTVGGMILIHNKIFEGEDYRAAEVGHMTLIPDGPMCYCGKKGCMDTYCASVNLSDMTDGMLAAFFEQVEQKNPLFLKKWNDYLNYLAVAINNVRMLFDCDVILGGDVGSYIDPYITELRIMLAARDTFNRSADYVKACKYHTEASAVGAGLMFVDEFITSV